MRLPVVPQISTKDGTSNKNARLTNTLKETRKSGDMAVIRPGLVLSAAASGIGNGIVSFDNELVSVYGSTLGLNTQAGSASFSLITSTIDANVQITAVRYMSGSKWLIGGINTNTEEGELYTLDTSTDSTTYVSSGLSIYDIKAIASNGETVVVASRPETFPYGTTGMFLSSVSSIAFSDVSLFLDDPFSVKYAGGRFVAIHTAVDESKISWSEDGGVAWSSYTLSPGTGHGRDLLYDGVSWWFYGGTGPIWSYKTTDFVTFSIQSLSGLSGGTDIKSCAYADGTYYLAAGDGLFTATNGRDWASISASVFRVKEGSDGNVYAGKVTAPDTLYRMDGTSLTQIDATAFTGTYQDIDANPTSSIIIGATGNASVVRLDAATTATIPALATITGTKFDFVQSPL